MTIYNNLHQFGILLETARATRAPANKVVLEFLHGHADIIDLHARDAQGNFVTAAWLAMQNGHDAALLECLRRGARVDVPVGAPPTAESGHTMLTYALTPEFAAEPSGRRIREILAIHEYCAAIRNQHPVMLAQSLQASRNAWRALGATNVASSAAMQLLAERHMYAEMVLTAEGKASTNALNDEETALTGFKLNY